MFKQHQPKREPLYSNVPIVVAGLTTLFASNWMVDRFSPLPWWGNSVAQLFLLIVIVGSVGYVQYRHQLETSSVWPLVEARIEDVEVVEGGWYRFSYSFRVNGGFHGADVHISDAEWISKPTQSMVGQTIQVRPNPRRLQENFILRSSLPGLRHSQRDWIKND
jgi:hypothetical protein